MILLSVASNYTMKNCTIEKNRGTGTFHTLLASNFTASNCLLTKNKAKDGGILIAEDSSNIFLNGIILKSNSVKTVWTRFDSVKCSVISIKGESLLHMRSCKVDSNCAQLKDPCAGIFVQGSSHFVSENCTFTRNTAYHFGSVYCSKSSIQWRTSTFQYNQAFHGGVLRSDDCSVRIEDCHMAHNVAERHGGCLVSTNDTLQVSNSQYGNF